MGDAAHLGALMQQLFWLWPLVTLSA